MLYPLQCATLERPAIVDDTVFPPCTLYDVVKLLEHKGILFEGENAVVVGANNIVGKPA